MSQLIYKLFKESCSMHVSKKITLQLELRIQNTGFLLEVANNKLTKSRPL